eukprot:949388-Rhodomonas_salina.2
MDDRRHNTTLDEPSCTAQTMTTESESMTREEEGSPDTGDSGLCSLINNVEGEVVLAQARQPRLPNAI